MRRPVILSQGLGYTLSRESVGGTLGWIVGIAPLACYGLVTGSQAPPPNGYLIYHAVAPPPAVSPLLIPRGSRLCTSGWLEMKDRGDNQRHAMALDDQPA